jgi:hypothetical protein
MITKKRSEKVKKLQASIQAAVSQIQNKMTGYNNGRLF